MIILLPEVAILEQEAEKMITQKYFSEFLKRLTSIDPDLFVPTQDIISTDAYFIGIIKDPGIKQVYSFIMELERELEEAIKSSPEKIERIEFFIDECWLIFWDFAKVEFPHINKVPEGSVYICSGWKFVLVPNDGRKPVMANKFHLNQN